jgi:hypothetical protein
VNENHIARSHEETADILSFKMLAVSCGVHSVWQSSVDFDRSLMVAIRGLRWIIAARQDQVVGADADLFLLSGIKYPSIRNPF